MRTTFAVCCFSVLILSSYLLNAQNLVADSSFEAGTVSWNETSATTPIIICDTSSCGDCGGSCLPLTGDYFAWFGGGLFSLEIASVDQDVSIPVADSARLKFWLYMERWNNVDSDSFLVRIDNGAPLFVATVADSSLYQTYTQISIDISAYGDGATHNLKFYGRTAGTPNQTIFLVDDVAIYAHIPTDTGDCSADAGEDLAMCNGDSRTIGGSPTADSGKAPYTYLWSPATNLNDPTLANPTANPAVNTMYQVLITDTLGCIANDVMELKATASGDPVAAFEITANEFTAVFKNNSVVSNVFFWDFGDGDD